jgi:CSLREA domain-containing protein
MNRSFSLLALRSSRLVLSALVVFSVIGYFIANPSHSSSMAAFTVNDTADSVDATPGDGVCADSLGRCTLRAAIMEANALAGPDTINLPAGTYTLTRGPNDDEESFDGAREDIGDLDVLNGDLTIVGAGAATTIVDGGNIDRIFEVNDFAGPGVALNLSISGVTLRNGDAKVGTFGTFSSGGAIQFDGFDIAGGPSSKTLTLTDCKITNNKAAGQGGGIIVFFGSLTINGTEISSNTSSNSSGGGVAYDAGASGASVRSLNVSNSSFLNNRALNPAFGNGGGLQSGGRATFNVEGNTFNGNQAGASGGGIFSDASLASNSKVIKKNRITNNSAHDGGGVANRSGSLSFTLNVVVGNTASDPVSSGFQQGTSVSGSLASLSNNWWGCNEGPSAAPCDRASGPLGFGSGPWLVLSHVATPNSVQTNSSTSLQADFFTPSSGSPVPAADLTALDGRAITFNAAVLGTISGADAAISGGKANATFNAGATGGSGSANATVDHATVTASITVTEPPGITCPANITTNIDPNSCSASVSFSTSATGFPTPTVTCKVGNTVITSPHTFPVGTTTVQCTATNGSSPDATCSFNVTVNDNQNPTITAPANVTVNTGPGAGSCSVMVSDATLGTANASDNCSGVTIARTGVPAGNIFPVGTTTVTYTATDASNNHASATQTVTVIDNTPPVITSCAPPQTATANSSGQATVPNFTNSVTASDNCGVTTKTQSPAAGTVVGVGVTTVTITVRDAANNSATCQTTFTVTQQGLQLTAVGPANMWIGLKNSDDVGTKFDLLAEVLRNGVVVASGQLNDVPGGSSGFNNAVQRSINMALTNGAVTFLNGDTASFRLSARISASSSHTSGTARLWYNDSAANSRVQGTVNGMTGNAYLRDGFTLATSAGNGPKKTADVTVNRNVGGNPFKPFGTWSATVSF